MKIKNIIILGGIVFAIYYLSKKKSSTITATVTPEVEGGDSVPDNGDINLENVMNGDKPQSEAEADVLRLFNQANLSYRGGARPSERLLADISLKREQAKLRLVELGLLEEFEEWKKKWGQAKYSKYPVPMLPPRKGNPFRPIKIGRPDLTRQRVIRKGMPLPRNRTYGVNTLGLANEPIMAV